MLSGMLCARNTIVRFYKMMAYRGKSRINGEPVIMVVTGLQSASANTKTGSMLQTWILADDINPVAAVSNGHDAAVCGNCPLRPANGGGCYVNVGQAPRNVWKKANGQKPYDAIDYSALDGQLLRCGSYGDPAAVPAKVWRRLIRQVKGLTGYTHQWRQRRFSWLASFCMASVASVAEKHQANRLGYRTFRTVPIGADIELQKDEIVCPASQEAGAKVTCSQCQLCCGQMRQGAKSIVIRAHGSQARKVR